VAVFAGDERKAMELGTATRVLTSVLEDEDCAYSTQKKALNAVAFFFKYVCGVEEPVFQVKRKKTGTRVLSQNETQRVFNQLDKPQRSGGDYGLAARLQPGAGKRANVGWQIEMTRRRRERQIVRKIALANTIGT
jgi:hypothetical protein